MKLYHDLFATTDDQDELADILTNMLACASNQDDAAIFQVQKLVDKTSGEIERTYEFFFNLCQVQMKQQLQEEAFRSLVHSYSLARQEDESNLHGDTTRFKIQELHALNSFS